MTVRRTGKGMRELIPKIFSVVCASAMFLLVRFGGDGQQLQGAEGVLVSAKEAFTASAFGAALGYGVGYLISFLVPKPVTASVSEEFRSGVSLLAAGNPEAALGAFQKSLAEAVGDEKADSLYNIAVCHLRLGSHDAALEALRQALGIDPSMAAEIEIDEDFAPLRGNYAFSEIVKAAAPSSTVRQSSE